MKRTKLKNLYLLIFKKIFLKKLILPIFADSIKQTLAVKEETLTCAILTKSYLPPKIYFGDEMILVSYQVSFGENSKIYTLYLCIPFSRINNISNCINSLDSSFYELPSIDIPVKKYTPENPPFSFLNNIHPSVLSKLLRYEHQQLIALILCCLNSKNSARIIESLELPLCIDIFKRIVFLGTSKRIISIIEDTINSVFYSLIDILSIGGIKKMSDILKRTNRSTERSIIETFEETDPELAEEIRGQMFAFEDIVFLDDMSVQKVLREVDVKDLALALKCASKEIRDKIFKNLSKRAGVLLTEDIEYLGPVGKRYVMEAQLRIACVMVKLQEAGEIHDVRDGEEVYA